MAGEGQSACVAINAVHRHVVPSLIADIKELASRIEIEAARIASTCPFLANQFQLTALANREYSNAVMQPIARVHKPAIARNQDLRTKVTPGKPRRQAGDGLSRGEPPIHGIVIEQDDTDLARRLSVPGLKVRATSDIAGVQWGKLLVNLNNALNALGDLPLRQQLAQRSWRRLFADQLAEGLEAVRAEGVRPVSSTPVPAGWTPHLLRLPDTLFATLLGGTMKIDAEARSSMWEDLQRGRRTEIDYLQGLITELADQQDLRSRMQRDAHIDDVACAQIDFGRTTRTFSNHQIEA